MSYDSCLDSESMLRETLDRINVDELKRLLALLPGVTLKAPRKAELVGALERFLLGNGAVQLWSQLQALEQALLMEAVHSDDGTLDTVGFQAKYGAVPAFEVEGKNRWQRTPTLLGLFLHPRRGSSATRSTASATGCPKSNVNAIVAGDTTNGAGRLLLEREILDPVAPILKLGGLGDQFQVSDAAPHVYSELVGIYHPRESPPSAREYP
jgi:hypothetical protein